RLRTSSLCSPHHLSSRTNCTFALSGWLGRPLAHFSSIRSIALLFVGPSRYDPHSRAWTSGCTEYSMSWNAASLFFAPLGTIQNAGMIMPWLKVYPIGAPSSCRLRIRPSQMLAADTCSLTSICPGCEPELHHWLIRGLILSSEANARSTSSG